jgi:hypothetical protein
MLYEKPYSSREPVVRFDERPVQLLDSKRGPLPMRAGRPPPGRTKNTCGAARPISSAR